MSVRESDYELIVVENDSDRLLGPERARRFGANVRYFQQFHGGVTTGTAAAEREAIYRDIIEQDARIRPGDRSHPATPPVFFGAIHPSGYRFLQHSVTRAIETQQSRHPQREK